MTYVTVEKTIEIYLEDVVGFIEECDDFEDIVEIVEKIKECHGIDVAEPDPLFDEILKSDSYESRDKIAFLKTIFNKMDLEEMKKRLS